MLKGILLGVVVQVISAVGYLLIANVTSIKTETFRTSLMIAISGIVAIVVGGYQIATRSESLSAISTKDVVLTAVGSIMVMFIAQVIFFVGLNASSLTTMSYTMLAYPFVSLALELAIGRVKPSSLGWRDLAGLLLMIGGYVVMVSKQ